MVPDNARTPSDSVEPDSHPEVPTQDSGRETAMPNRHAGQVPERPGHHDDGALSTPAPPTPDADPDPDDITPPVPVPDPDPEDPSVTA